MYDKHQTHHIGGPNPIQQRPDRPSIPRNILVEYRLLSEEVGHPIICGEGGVFIDIQKVQINIMRQGGNDSQPPHRIHRHQPHIPTGKYPYRYVQFLIFQILASCHPQLQEVPIYLQVRQGHIGT